MTNQIETVQGRYVQKLIEARNAAYTERDATKAAVADKLQLQDAIILALVDRLGGSCRLNEADIAEYIGQCVHIEKDENMSGGRYFEFTTPDYIPPKGAKGTP